ncbi:MAG: DUF885 domain-containing protein [Chloroflexota bacterium]|nr:DUF885 domain-containing protein [Chloroflexota bacterium]
MSDLSSILPPLPLDGPEADRRHEELVRGRFERQLHSFPNFGTYLGIHAEDGRLADLSRHAVLEELAAEQRFLTDIESLDGADMSPPGSFERELSLLSVRRSIFDTETQRLWERKASATDEVGDGLFLLFARDFAPLSERLDSIASRLEAAPIALEQSKDRLGDRPVRLWNELELDAAGSLPSLFDEVVAAGRSELGEDSAEQRRLEAASDGARKALEDYSGWLRELLGRSVDDFALGSEAYDELISLRAFDGLTTDEILEIGHEQLAVNHEGRRAAAREVDPSASEAEVLDRIKSDHPERFEEALAAYQEVMFRARDFVAERGLGTLPAGETLSVIPTPEYLRRVMPFAAYFSPAKFDADPRGLYIVTPSVDDDPGAMREHNHASISNTSIHEAYPGHHHQLSAAMRHPSLARLMVDAPEFVEGWGMYCEQMMREQGFDATPRHRVIMYTDAIWRACRIILDIRLHRGEIGVDEAIDFLVEHTGFERPNATAEVHRYTYTPTYQLSYLLGKVLLLRLRDDEQRRLGTDFSLGRFHDALLYSGSLPISFHRRLLAGEGGGATLPAGAA